MENQSQTAADFICYLYVEFYHLGVSLTYNSDSWRLVSVQGLQKTRPITVPLGSSSHNAARHECSVKRVFHSSNVNPVPALTEKLLCWDGSSPRLRIVKQKLMYFYSHGGTSFYCNVGSL